MCGAKISAGAPRCLACGESFSVAPPNAKGHITPVGIVPSTLAGAACGIAVLVTIFVVELFDGVDHHFELGSLVVGAATCVLVGAVIGFGFGVIRQRRLRRQRGTP